MFVNLLPYWPYLLGAAVVAYLCGSISSAILITRAVSNQDIRDVGSGNAGMTNVLRTLGSRPAVWTTLGDVGKSVFSAWLGGLLFVWAWGRMQTGVEPAVLSEEQARMAGQYIAGLFCTIGHTFPVFFGFRGGKGVLVGLGMLIVTDWRVALAVVIVFVTVVALSRMVSLGSLCGAATAIPATFLLRRLADGDSTGTVVFATVMTTAVVAILFIMHRGNIQRIAAGCERKLSFGKKEN
ncbi:MAG: glycerol-3-phosphate 1-O-acyltransferase PlsY [Ruminococcaceae bacterium]|nr:glycerol-3-phosphate 1-O-acyltransferase PlsY [Oscillospiraceae bacterium]